MAAARARASRPYQRFLWLGHGLLPGGHPVDDDAWSMSATSCCVARHAELPCSSAADAGRHATALSSANATRARIIV